MNAIGRRIARGRPEAMVTIGVALLLIALAAGFWPHSVTLNGVRRSCDPVVSHLVPSDPGHGYPVELMDACGGTEVPEMLTMLVAGVSALLIGGLGGADVANRRSRQQLLWTPPPNWPAAPPGWRPVAGWAPPPDWPLPPDNWQWWQRTAARFDRSQGGAAPPQ
jgi:hypothetical protein